MLLYFYIDNQKITMLKKNMLIFIILREHKTNKLMSYNVINL